MKTLWGTVLGREPTCVYLGTPIFEVDTLPGGIIWVRRTPLWFWMEKI